ncbi:MAG: hypothetical protein ACKV0T_13440 [Planctomycetales bacterium]
MYKGDPVKNAIVQFICEGAPRNAKGVTDDAGKFKLSMYGANDGAVPGEHKILVFKETASAAPKPVDTSVLDNPAKMAGMSQENKDKKDAGAELEKLESLLPTKYAHADTTPLKETVTEAGPNDFLLTLSD